ncbi:uncharacterized protein METZ01_LOCUS246475 [marine metagenome]|uniref:cysteine desulfurase n=1 Tax=marine metagenome TaxID=408172 RepID=A0A382I4I8_9ZZZZ
MFENIKSKFPVFIKKPNLVFLDTAASALKVDDMIKAVNNCYSFEYSNIHRGVYDLSAKLTQKFEDSRNNISDFILSPSYENIIFTKSATEAINLVANSITQDFIKEGDEIIISHLEHHANIVPWHIAQKLHKFKLVPVDINDIGEINYKDLLEKVNSKTKLISLTHMSNVTGAITDFEKINDIRNKFDIPLLIDGCQFTPHHELNIKELNPDFYVFSAHKLYGPSGLGILYMQDKWLEILGPYQGGGSMIENVNILDTTYAQGNQKFEAGTPPIAQVIGFSAAIDFLKSLDMKKVFSYECELHDYTLEKLKSINDFKIYGNSKNKGSLISFNIEGLHHNDVALLLNQKNIAIRSGHHCAQPLMKKLNITGSARASFGVYNNKEDVNYFVESIKDIKNFIK